MSGPHDMPTAAQLLEAVREFLDRDVMPATDGRIRFHARVAVNVLAMVQRELELGEAQAAAHHRGLARLGFADDAGLARAIRSGAIPDHQLPVVADFVRTAVRAKLEVANPPYLDGPRRPGA